eukprot:Rmarinus@m.19179
MSTWVLLLFVFFAFSTGNDDAECSSEEVLSFLNGVSDAGVLSSAGCHTGSLSKSCCEAYAELMGHRCANASLVYFEDYLHDDNSHYMALLAAEDECGLKIGEGALHEDCGDGTVYWWEKCDDGNDIAGDGCSECWVEPGYSCSAAEAGPSVCRSCTEDCAALFRDICVTPLGPCGDCAAGYQEIDGECAKIVRTVVTVLSASISVPEDNWDCRFEEVATDYIAGPLVRTSVFVENSRGVVAGSANCSLEAAIFQSDSPVDDDVVLVVSIPFAEITTSTIRIQHDRTVVITSDVPGGAVIHADGDQTFVVFTGTSLLLHNVVLMDGMAEEGSAILAFGTTVLENVTVTNQTMNWPGTAYYHQCDGYAIATYGPLYMFDVVIRDNVWVYLEKFESCLRYHGSLLLTTGGLHMDNVLFMDNVADSNIVSLLKTASQDPTLRRISFLRNTSHRGSVFRSEVDVILTHFVAEGNAGVGGAVLALHGRTSGLNTFIICDNTASDNGGVIQNFGLMTMSDGTISTNHSPEGTPGFGGSLRNSGEVQVANVVFQNNAVGVLDNSGVASHTNCSFSGNRAPVGTEHYISVNNIGRLGFDLCNYRDFNGGATLRSTTEVVVRNSYMAGFEHMLLADCATTVLQDGVPTSVCGKQALCSDSDTGGVDCACPSDYVGNPFDVCAPPIRIDMLPDSNIVLYTEKGESTLPRVARRLIVSGLGVVTWSLATELPPWLSMDTMNGTFEKAAKCDALPADLEFIFNPENVTGENPQLSELVVLETRAFYTGMLILQDQLNITVMMVVEIEPNATTSEILYYDPYCEPFSRQCFVSEGTRVIVMLLLRDHSSLLVGRGGDAFTARVITSADEVTRVTSVSTVDRGTGEHELFFIAPNQPFYVDVLINGVAVTGGPLRFRVSCDSDREWDSSSQSCVDSPLDIPLGLMGITALVVFLAGVAAINLSKRIRLPASRDSLQKEAVKAVASMSLDVLDLLTDVASLCAVLTDGRLSEYVPYYLSCFVIAAVASLVGLGVLGRDMYTLFYTPSCHTDEGALRHGLRLEKGIYVSGLGEMSWVTTTEGLNLAIASSKRLLRRHVISFLLLFCEDFPVQILNIIVLLNEKEWPLVVLITTQVSFVMIGIKFSSMYKIAQDFQRINRLKEKRQMVRSLRSVRQDIIFHPTIMT